MTPHVPDNDTATAEEPLYVEHRRLTPTSRWILVTTPLAPVAVVAFIYIDEGRWMDASELALIIAATAVFLLLLCWAAFGRYGGERKHIRVDGQGLWVGGRLLPAAELGVCEVVPEPRARVLLFRQRYHDVLVNRPGSSYSLSHDGPPVLARQDRPGLRRKGWLVATDHPDELLAALHTLRQAQQAHGGAW